jgi:glycine betaine/proline transport system ATP-binding protein
MELDMNKLANGKPAQQSVPQVSVRGVWKVFGAQPQSVIAALEGGASKADILTQSGHVVAVRNVSFDVQAGETFVVMGLSGSGKSTLLRCLPRLIEPTVGHILIDGRDIAAIDKDDLRDLRRHRMSMVFQHFGLFPHRRIIDNVAYGLEIQGMKRAARYERARTVLELVNLTGWENHYPNQLSGGMQQRVGLARALAVEPEILLFDEPFSALDPLIRREMQDELLNLQSRVHKTLIFITHDFAEAVKLGTHIAIMKDGEFVQVGSAQELVLHPVNDYVRDFTRDVSRLRVLTAASVMLAVQDGLTGSPIPASTHLDRLLAIVMQSEQALPVSGEHNQIVGCVNRQCVLDALQGE